MKSNISVLQDGHIISFLLLFLLLTTSCFKTEKPNYQKQSFSRKGMVVSAHYLATQAGLEVLRKGGNAIDAAIATHFALAVVYPRAGNLGGGGFMLYRDSSGLVKSLDFREIAPFDAHRDMFTDSSGQVIYSSTEGGLSSGIPGSVAGMWAMHQELGAKLPFEELLQTAIRLAEEGFKIGELEAQRLNEHKSLFVKYNSDTIPFVKNQVWKQGDLLVQKTLANTLKKIAKEGAIAFYQGEIAERIVEKSQRNGGIISQTDLSKYKVQWRDPIQIPFKQYQVYAMGPPSSGGITLGQILKMIEPFSFENGNLLHYYNLHLCAEASRRAFEDRAYYLGDPDFVNIPLNKLLSGEYLKAKMLNYQPTMATVSKAPVQIPNIILKETYETTHFSIIDTEGNAVSLTTTLNGNYGSGLWVDGAGFFLNNEMDDFSIQPGLANQFGLIGSKANEISPGKRMLSSMCPTIITRDKEIYMVLGSPGGPTIISAIYQTFLHTSEFGLMLSEALSIPRFHHQWIPDQILLEESAIGDEFTHSLTQKGHTIKSIKRMGSVSAILRHATGSYEGAADPRDESHAEGL